MPKQATQAKSLGPNDSVSEAAFLRDPHRGRLSFPSTFIRTEFTPNLGTKRKGPGQKQVLANLLGPTDLAQWNSGVTTSTVQDTATSDTYVDQDSFSKDDDLYEWQMAASDRRANDSSSEHRQDYADGTVLARPMPARTASSRSFLLPPHEPNTLNIARTKTVPAREMMTNDAPVDPQYSQRVTSKLQRSVSDNAVAFGQPSGSNVGSIAPSSTAIPHNHRRPPQRVLSNAGSITPSSTALHPVHFEPLQSRNQVSTHSAPRQHAPSNVGSITPSSIALHPVHFEPLRGRELGVLEFTDQSSR